MAEKEVGVNISDRAVIDLEAMSNEALIAVMQALNTSPWQHRCEGDRQAFSNVSSMVRQRAQGASETVEVERELLWRALSLDATVAAEAKNELWLRLRSFTEDPAR